MSLVNDGSGNMVMPVGPMYGNSGSSVDKMIRKLEMMKYDAPDSETMTAIDNVISKLEDY